MLTPHSHKYNLSYIFVKLATEKPGKFVIYLSFMQKLEQN